MYGDPWVHIGDDLVPESWAVGRIQCLVHGKCWALNTCSATLCVLCSKILTREWRWFSSSYSEVHREMPYLLHSKNLFRQGFDARYLQLQIIVTMSLISSPSLMPWPVSLSQTFSPTSHPSLLSSAHIENPYLFNFSLPSQHLPLRNGAGMGQGLADSFHF